MRFLIFLLLGTLIFGFAFPAMLLFIGLFGVIVLALIIFNMLRSGSSFRVYTSRSFESPHRENYSRSGEQQIFNSPTDAETEEPHQSSYFEDEGEVIELPATALRKEDEKEKDK